MDSPAYGLWLLVVLNSLVFIIFAFSFSKPRSARDWRSFGAFAAFIVALFTEMYGFPLTIYLLSGWLGQSYPALDPFSHDAGHLWDTLLGWQGDPHLNPLHLLSNLLIFGGFIIIARAWDVLYKAQRSGQLARTGPYVAVRHPQYGGFILIMFGFVLQWPTLLTLVMFPILVWMYVALARREEREARAAFGQSYASYARVTPAFVPRFRRLTPLGWAAAKGTGWAKRRNVVQTRWSSPRRWFGVVALSLLSLATACAAAGSNSPSSGVSPTTQVSEAGQVKIAVTWQGPTASPAFTVVVDTHSVDLDGYDLSQLAVLRTDDGREARPSGWDAPAGGHHRSGTLTFPTTRDDGTPMIGPVTRTLELVIRDVAGVPARSFQWTL
jgi:protein-S-isoprenylcysteine O-methyltransferase Ste14